MDDVDADFADSPAAAAAAEASCGDRAAEVEGDCSTRASSECGDAADAAKARLSDLDDMEEQSRSQAALASAAQQYEADQVPRRQRSRKGRGRDRAATDPEEYNKEAALMKSSSASSHSWQAASWPPSQRSSSSSWDSWGQQWEGSAGQGWWCKDSGRAAASSWDAASSGNYHHNNLSKGGQGGGAWGKPYGQYPAARSNAYATHPNSSAAKKLQCQFTVGIAEEPDFRVVRKLLGSHGKHVKAIAEQTGAKLRLRGQGSGFLEGPEQEESTDGLMLCVSSQEAQGYETAKNLVSDLLEDVYRQYRKFRVSSMGCHEPELHIDLHEGPREGSY
jgi:hypothetical protein